LIFICDAEIAVDALTTSDSLIKPEQLSRRIASAAIGTRQGELALEP
jgi:hypothetical protein